MESKTRKQKIQAHLNVEKGNYSDSVIILNEQPITIGRGTNADIKFNEKTISREHIQIHFKNNRFYVKDLGTTNGTIVDDTKIDQQPHELSHGSKIVLGIYESEVILRFSELPVTLNNPVQIQDSKPIHVDQDSMNIYVNGELVEPPLGKIHFKVFNKLYTNEGKVLTKNQIYEAGWGEVYEDVPTDDSIQKVIKRIRKTIEPNPKSPMYLQTRRGIGYIFLNGL